MPSIVTLAPPVTRTCLCEPWQSMVVAANPPKPTTRTSCEILMLHDPVYTPGRSATVDPAKAVVMAFSQSSMGPTSFFVGWPKAARHFSRRASRTGQSRRERRALWSAGIRCGPIVPTEEGSCHRWQSRLGEAAANRLAIYRVSRAERSAGAEATDIRRTGRIGRIRRFGRLHRVLQMGIEKGRRNALGIPRH
eukprot:3223439-Rhodomonas_salina.4